MWQVAGLVRPALAHGRGELALDDALVEVVAAALGGRLVDVDAARREDPLPGPVAVGVRVLAGEGVGQGDEAGGAGEVISVLGADALEVGAQGLGQAAGQDGDAVLAALAVVHGELEAEEVHVLDPEPAALEQAQAGAVHEGAHEPGHAAQLPKDCVDLLAREHERQARGLLGAGRLLEPGELAAEDVAVEKEKRAEGLVLGRGADVAREREVREVAGHRAGAELVGVPLAVEQDVAADPGEVRLLGAAAEVPRADRQAHALEEPRGPGGDPGRPRRRALAHSLLPVSQADATRFAPARERGGVSGAG